MAHQTGIFHHVGTFFLFAASILLLITTISAPVINDISMMKVTLTNTSALRNSSVTFGTFGYCVLDVAPAETDQDWCTRKMIGYQPAVVMANIDGTGFSTASSATADGLTNVMILHPIACGVSFIAFLLALGSGVCGALLASIFSAIAWIITIVAMACDFTSFGIVKNHVNDDGSGSSAAWGAGIWCILAAMILLFLATFIVFFTCFSARKHRRDVKHNKVETSYANGGVATTQRRRHFWQRRSRY